MRTSYLDYAMSVIVARALPDVRDGLKPVQRRILFAMKEGGYDWNRAYRKSSRIVGDVMSKYHPHGDGPIYEAMVRMAQDFTMRAPLVDGQGNFGSMDDDPPAAMRYTEARLSRLASDGLLEDIRSDTVDFQSNYDETGQEPVVLPSRFPNLLVNGAQGIAVGMATNIPPHNLGEVVSACRAYIKNPAITTAELMEFVPGPDFPTGGVILGKRRLRHAYETGQGSLPARAWTEVETLKSGREAIIIHEVAPGVSKGQLLERLGQVAREKIVEGISDVRDESARGSVRVVIELKRGQMAELILNRLWRHTKMQAAVGFNLRAIEGAQPKHFSLRGIVASFVGFREEVVGRRTAWNLARARERAHLVLGLVVAVSHIDEVIRIIRAAKDAAAAREALLARDWAADGLHELLELIADPEQSGAEDGRYTLSEAQAKGILELRLQRLTGLERDKLAEELRQLGKEIEESLSILRSREKTLAIVDAELAEISERFAVPRRTRLEEGEGMQETEDLIARENVVITLTHGGYVKRVPIAAYKAQRRGGRGRSGMSTRDDDFVTTAFVTDNHRPLLFFSSKGMVYRLKVWQLPEGGPTSRGKPLVNLLPVESGEEITALLPMPADEASWARTDVIFVTGEGSVRRNSLSDFVRINANGKIAMKLKGSARLVGVALAEEGDDVLLATQAGQAVRFPVSDLRVFRSRGSTGVRGVRLRKGDSVISLAVLAHAKATAEECRAYLAESRRRRLAAAAESGAGVGEGAEGAEEAEEEGLDEEGLEEGETGEENGAGGGAVSLSLSEARYQEMAENEQIILSLAADGFGKRSSSYGYPIRRRGAWVCATGRGRSAGRARWSRCSLWQRGARSCSSPTTGG